MAENITFYEFLRQLANCSGDEGLELISKFQSGGLTIEGLGVEDFE